MKATSYIPHIDDIRPYWEQVTEWIRDHLGRELELLTCGYEFVIYPDAEAADVTFDVPEYGVAISIRIQGHAIFQDSTRKDVLTEIGFAVATALDATGFPDGHAEH